MLRGYPFYRAAKAFFFQISWLLQACLQRVSTLLSIAQVYHLCHLEPPRCPPMAQFDHVHLGLCFADDKVRKVGGLLLERSLAIPLVLRLRH